MKRTPTPHRFHSAALRAASALYLAAISGVAWAHPGHDGGLLHGLLHPFHGLDHLLVAIAVGIWGARLGARAVWALPVAFVSAMAAGALSSIAGFALPMTEAAIALSVAVLGIAIAWDARMLPTAGTALVAVFALFHGSAHGAEAVADLSGYALGMMIGTLALHAGGIAAALALKARPLVLRIASAPMALLGLALLVNRLQ